MVCWSHLRWCQMSHHGHRICHGPRKLETMQTGHLVNQTYPTTKELDSHHLAYMTIVAPGQIFTDQTGHFPIQSSRGHKYVVICYEANCNAILSKPIKNRTAQELLRAYKKFYTILAKAGHIPMLHKLDIETSTEV